jgi:hypothetical protein
MSHRRPRPPARHARGTSHAPQQSKPVRATDARTVHALVSHVQTFRAEYRPAETITSLHPFLPLLLRTLPAPASVALLDLLMWALDQCGRYEDIRTVAKQIVELGQSHTPSALWNRSCYLCAPEKCDRTPVGKTAQWLSGALVAIDQSDYAHDVFSTPHHLLHARLMLLMDAFPLGDTLTLQRLIMRLTAAELNSIAIKQALYNVGADTGAGARDWSVVRDRPRVVFTGEDFNARPTGLLIRRFIDHPPADMSIAVLQIGNPTQASSAYSFRSPQVQYYEVADAEQARRILDRERFDAIVDTKGLMFKNHCCLLQPRHAPLQVHWLAYPGTLGLSSLDYTVGDPIVTPSDGRRELLEKVIRLPECYQINDDAYRVETIGPQQGRMHRRPGRMLIACVNMNYKTCPDTIRAWLEILRRCPQADIAIVARSKQAIDNIRKAFRYGGVDPSRVQAHLGQARGIFIANVRRDVDLVVDPFRCPGHTTMSDAITAGVPVISLHSDTFHGSVARSLATTMGLQHDLSATNPRQYVSKAIRLLNNPEELADLRTRVRFQRRWSALYEPRRYMAHFWDGLRGAFQQIRNKTERRDIDVPATPRFADRLDVPTDGSVAALIIRDETSVVIRLKFDGIPVMISEWHGEVWADTHCVTTTFQRQEAPPTQPYSKGDIRFTRSPKGTCVVHGMRAILLGIPFPKLIEHDGGTTTVTLRTTSPGNVGI